MAFPTTLDTFPSAATLAAETFATAPHSTLHDNLGIAIAALEAKVGITSSAVTTSLDYKVAHNVALVANNLSDLANAGTARTNLGLGSSATHASTDFLLVANNLSDVTASSARTNLGLGSAAVVNTGTAAGQVPTGGVITAAGPQGDASHTQVVTFNAAGQLTTVTNTAIALDASAVTAGTLGTTRGGTGISNPTAHKLVVGAGSSALTQLAVGTNGQLLIGQTTADPAFTTVSGDVTIDQTGATTLVGTANVESIIRANSVDQLTAAAANVNLNSNKIISLANGTTSSDAVAYGQALIKAGIAGGQTAIGGSAASENLTLQSTSHATRGNVLMVDSPIVDNLTSVGAGAVIGSLLFRARDNEGSPVVASGGLIQAVVDANSAWSVLHWPSRLEFYAYNSPTNASLNVMTIDSNGAFYTSPVIAANVVSTYGVKIDSSGNIASVASIKSTAATSGVGYATGAGGAVTQLTNKSTAFPTISKVCGTLTWNNAALAASTSVTAASSTNAAIAATDTVVFNHVSGGTLGAYTMTCTPAGGTWTLTLRNVSTGSLSEAPVFAFSIIKAVTS